MKPVHTVGILGLGKMGRPIAAHLVAKGFKVVGYDPLEEARNKALALGARSAASAREAARASDLVIIVVGFDGEVEEVIFGKDGVLEGARPGLVVALGSTVAPRYSKRLASRLAEKSLVLLDIPLARGEAAATAGNLLILWACISVNDEGLRLGRALGVDPERLCEALRHGSAQNWAMDTQAERSGMPWAEKDMSIVLEEADRARLSLPLAGTVKETIKGLKIRMGLGMPEIPEHL